MTASARTYSKFLHHSVDNKRVKREEVFYYNSNQNVHQLGTLKIYLCNSMQASQKAEEQIIQEFKKTCTSKNIMKFIRLSSERYLTFLR